jgi:hypothetical protein
VISPLFSFISQIYGVEEMQGKHMLTEELEGYSTKPSDPSPGGSSLRAYMTQAHNTLCRIDYIGYIPR